MSGAVPTADYAMFVHDGSSPRERGCSLIDKWEQMGLIVIPA